MVLVPGRWWWPGDGVATRGLVHRGIAPDHQALDFQHHSALGSGAMPPDVSPRRPRLRHAGTMCSARSRGAIMYSIAPDCEALLKMVIPVK